MNAGRSLPERMEGLAIGRQLADGTYSLLIGTDNDFSIAEIGGTLFDVYTDGTSGPVGGDALGRTLFPSQLFAFRADLPSYMQPVPEPASATLLLAGFAAIVTSRRAQKYRRQR